MPDNCPCCKRKSSEILSCGLCQGRFEVVFIGCAECMECHLAIAHSTVVQFAGERAAKDNSADGAPTASCLSGTGGEFDLRHRENSPLEESGLSAPVGPGAQCERPGTSTPSVQDVLGDCGEVCHGESLLHVVGSEMGLSRGGSPLEKVPNGGFHPQPGRAIGSNREHPVAMIRLQERGIGHSKKFAGERAKVSAICGHASYPCLVPVAMTSPAIQFCEDCPSPNRCLMRGACLRLYTGQLIDELTCAVMRAEERARR